MPWLGAGGAAELGRRLGTRRRRHRILVAFPGVCFTADCAFRGERVVFACGYTPFAGRVVAGPPLRAPCGPHLLTRLADQWAGVGAMPGSARRMRRGGRWGRP